PATTRRFIRVRVRRPEKDRAALLQDTLTLGEKTRKPGDMLDNIDHDYEIESSFLKLTSFDRAQAEVESIPLPSLGDSECRDIYADHPLRSIFLKTLQQRTSRAADFQNAFVLKLKR